MGKIVYRDGKAYAVVVDILMSEPTKLTMYYPLMGTPPDGSETAAYMPGDNGYYVYLNGRKIGFFCLVNGKDTVPTWSEREPVAPPKARKGTETRWNGYRGTWEKLTKRQGWVAA